ncbi:MAG: M15 family metallopeptidase [Campylobacterota bacterium]|nr:M15 family metallopeptidase [Campylobacterota bacterium]
MGFLWMNRRDFLQLSALASIVPSTLLSMPVRYSDKDIYFSLADYECASRLLARLKRVQSIVGHGNFNIISFDYTLLIPKYHRSVGRFQRDELELFEKLFFINAANYGFYGEKVVDNITTVFNKKEMKKVPYTGHFLYQGDALEHYEKIRRCVGDSIILTSGVRSIVKQMYLFLGKVFSVEGNLSLASSSLAPAGYSYHGIGDFDVGKVGFGARNFTRDFETTDEYKKLMDLGFVTIRYHENNPFGVRYEPWHIKVVNI